LVAEQPSLNSLVFPINALPACQLADGGVDEICWSADLKYQAVARYYHQVDAELLFFFSDIVIQAEAMGAGIQYSQHGMPSVVRIAETIYAPRASCVARMQINGNVLRRLADEFPDKLLSTMVYGPFTVAGQLVGEQRILRETIENPDRIHSLLEKTLEVARSYASLLLDAGAGVLWVSDPLAALLPPEGFQEFAGEPLARLFELHSSGPTVSHICGDTTLIVEQILRTGTKAISFDQCMDLLAIEDRVPPDITIVGNLDPVEILELASEDEVVSTTEDLATIMGVKKNFALSTGCAVPPSGSIQNVKKFVSVGREVFQNLIPYREYLENLGSLVHCGDRSAVHDLLKKRKDLGIDPLMTINGGLMRAIRKGSARYETKQCFLPEVLLMVDAFYEGYKELELDLGLSTDRPFQVVLGTVQGDIHEIGKDLVRIMMETNGLRVLDLGANVSSEQFVESCKSSGAPVVALSAFITSARKQLVDTINLFIEREMKSVAVIVGGAAVNHQIASSLGANGYAKDAIGAVKLVRKILKDRTRLTR
jgi:MtaA/CmuA family methyltransferase